MRRCLVINMVKERNACSSLNLCSVHASLLMGLNDVSGIKVWTRFNIMSTLYRGSIHAHTFSSPSSMCVWEDNRSVGIDWFLAASVSLLMLESQHFLLILFSVECE